MRVDSIRRWQWLLISAALGLILGWAWRSSCRNLWTYGEEINDPARFEAALLNTIGGQPQFKDIFVHQQDLPAGSGGMRPVHLVWGKYCTGLPESDGQFHWRPAFFVADIPYRPRTDLGQLGLESQTASSFANLQSSTVIDFLSALSTTRGVRFTNAWWDTYPLLSVLLATVIIVGGIWPSVVNLLAFGQLRRPREPRGVDLSQVKQPAPPPQRQVSEQDLLQLHELDAELESRLPGRTNFGVERSEREQSEVPVLNAEPAELTNSPQHDPKSFAAKADDFYPTELRNRDTPS